MMDELRGIKELTTNDINKLKLLYGSKVELVNKNNYYAIMSNEAAGFDEAFYLFNSNGLIDVKFRVVKGFNNNIILGIDFSSYIYLMNGEFKSNTNLKALNMYSDAKDLILIGDGSQNEYIITKRGVLIGIRKFGIVHKKMIYLGYNQYALLKRNITTGHSMVDILEYKNDKVNFIKYDVTITSAFEEEYGIDFNKILKNGLSEVHIKKPIVSIK